LDVRFDFTVSSILINFDKQTYIPMKEIKVLYSLKHRTIEASKFKFGTYKHKAKVVATFYDLETADNFIARVLNKWDFNKPNELPSNDELKSEWGKFEYNIPS